MEPAQAEATPAYSYHTTGRNWTTLITTVVVWGVLLTLILVVDMALWLAGVVFLFTLPALFDFITARTSGLTINTEQINWYAGRVDGDIPRRFSV